MLIPVAKNWKREPFSDMQKQNKNESNQKNIPQEKNGAIKIELRHRKISNTMVGGWFSGCTADMQIHLMWLPIISLRFQIDIFRPAAFAIDTIVLHDILQNTLNAHSLL